MTSEENGEWILIKVWECKKCKLLLRGSRIHDHVCSIEDREDQLSKLRTIIDNQNHIIEEQKITIENKGIIIDSRNTRIDGLENFIKELNSLLEDKDNDIKTKGQIIEGQKATIEGQNAIIEEQKILVDDSKRTIIDQEITIEKLNKNQNKVVEKVVYLEKNVPKTDRNGSVENINVDIWNKDYRIKDSKDEGYREEIEFEIFERGKGREKIIIKSGKVVKKPDDIIVVGKHSPEGFIVKGIYRN